MDPLSLFPPIPHDTACGFVTDSALCVLCAASRKGNRMTILWFLVHQTMRKINTMRQPLERMECGVSE